MTSPDRILTVPSELSKVPSLALTGNEFVSLPVIDAATGQVESVNVLHMGARGLIEFSGKPLLTPVVGLNGEPVSLEFDELTYDSHFMPRLQANPGSVHIALQYAAPPGFKGFLVTLKARNVGTEKIAAQIGLQAQFEQASLAVFSRRNLSGPHRAYFDTWTRAAVFEATGGQPLAALALRTPEGEPWDVQPASKWSRADGGGVLSDGRATFSHVKECELAPGEHFTQVYYCGVGSEGDGAGLNTVDLARHGWKKLVSETKQWLDDRARPAESAAARDRINRNMFFSLFFAAGRTIDTEELVLVTSRSPRYYVAAAHWSRDSLLWTFPAVLMADPDLAREHLLAAFRLYTQNVGLHALYIDGTLLYPGFELDEVCAFIIALGRYVRATSDTDILQEPDVVRGLQRVIRSLKSVRHPEHGLGTTFLLPTDDPAHFPYHTYNNALLSLSWGILGRLLDESSYTEESRKVRRSIQELLVVDGPFGPMYCGSSNLKGDHILYDEPPGSLELLTHYGYVDESDEVYRNTIAWIYSNHNPHFDDSGRFGGPECPHAPHPWLLTMANGLLTGRDLVDQALAVRLDSGFACETFDRETGVVKTGAAFASCAGFFAYALDRALTRRNHGGSKEEIMP